MHAVSVGEVQAIQGIVRALKDQGASIVCTVTTKTGYDLARERLGHMAIVIPSPMDFSWTVQTFIRAIRPRLYIAAETELWPNLFYHLHRLHIPVAIVNGRISDRSYGRYKMIAPVLKSILRNVDVFAMQSTEDVRRMITIGAPKERVFDVGNIKFDDSPDQGNAAVRMDPAHPVWVAGSTHPGEEEILLDVFGRLRSEFPDWLLVLAPRHVERAPAVAQNVTARGFKHIFLSQMPDLPQPDTVVIVDVIGRLRELYNAASLVFVGKSLCVGGGHNIIEPAMVGKAVIIGPMMDNFRDITQCFVAGGGIVQVNDSAGLEQAAAQLMASPGEREKMGARAKAIVEQNRGARDKTLALLKPWL